MSKSLHLFYDTETSGFIKKDLSPDDPKQQWCCQIGAILSTEDEIISQINLLVKANERTIPTYLTQNVHGISVEDCDKNGFEEAEILEVFAMLMKDEPMEVCHNRKFDRQYIDQMFQRQMDNLSDFARSKYFLQLDSFCTMQDKRIVKFCGLKNKAGRPKWPKLEELYKILFGKDFDNAHNAFADVLATRACYYELIKREVITG